MKNAKFFILVLVVLFTCDVASADMDKRTLEKTKKETERTYSDMIYKYHRAMELYKKSDADTEQTKLAKKLAMECATNAQKLGRGGNNVYEKDYIVQTRYGAYSFSKMKDECSSLHQKLAEKKLTGCFKSAVLVLSQNKSGSWGATGFKKEVPGQKKLARVSVHGDIDLKPIDCSKMPGKVSAPSTYKNDSETIDRLCGKGYPGYLSKGWTLDDSNQYRLKRNQKMVCYIKKT